MDRQMAYSEVINEKQFQNDVYYKDFKKILKEHSSFFSNVQNSVLFFSYCLGRKIQDLVKQIKQNQQSIQIQDSLFFLDKVIENYEIKKYCQNLKKSKKKVEIIYKKSCKDRKNSFFRTIIKHLKDQSQKNDQQLKDVICQIHKKLCKNTISKEDIDTLFESYSTQIINYFQSGLIYQDIVNKNKSKKNKDYYLLHLQQIFVEARQGRLGQFPFYQTKSLKKQITNIAKTLYYGSRKVGKKNKNRKRVCRQSDKKKINNTQQSGLNKQEQGQEEIFEVLNLKVDKDSKQNYMKIDQQVNMNYYKNLDPVSQDEQSELIKKTRMSISKRKQRKKKKIIKKDR